jgi:hypothetical protein
LLLFVIVVFLVVNIDLSRFYRVFWNTSSEECGGVADFPVMAKQYIPLAVSS